MARNAFDVDCDLRGWPTGSEPQGYATWKRVGHRAGHGEGFCYGIAQAGYSSPFHWSQFAPMDGGGPADGGAYSFRCSGVPGRIPE